MKIKARKSILLLIILVLIFIFFHFEINDFFSLQYLKQHQYQLQNYYHNNTVFSIFIFAVIYIITTALSLPGATVLTLLGGVVFGTALGVFIVSFASTIGATIAFLGARYFLRDFIQDKFPKKIKIINKGIEQDGIFYLLTLRLVPLFPFFLINLLMGVTSIRTVQFFFVSQVGMLLGTIVYVNAGKEIAKVESLDGIMSPSLILALLLLGVLPYLARFIMKLLKRLVV